MSGGTMANPNEEKLNAYMLEVIIASRLRWAKLLTGKLEAVYTTRVHRKNGLLSVIKSYIRIFSDTEYIKEYFSQEELERFNKAISSTEKFLMEEVEVRRKEVKDG